MIGPDSAPGLRRRLGPIGVWLGPIGDAPAVEERAALRRLEQLGYGSAWFSEGPINREALSHAALLLAATEQMTIATGIANIWVRDPAAARNGADALAESSNGRFVLGLGVSHPLAITARGHRYTRPVSTMRAYLDAIDAQYPGVVQPADPTPIVLAALRPRMLELARERAAGAHTFFVPPEHTAAARAILGPKPILVPEQGIILERDATRARALARRHIALHLNLPNYQANLREIGFGSADFADGGSDRLVDAIVAWGDEQAIGARVHEHLDAGADHVAVQAYARSAAESLAQLERLAPVLMRGL